MSRLKFLSQQRTRVFYFWNKIKAQNTFTYAFFNIHSLQIWYTQDEWQSYYNDFQTFQLKLLRFSVYPSLLIFGIVRVSRAFTANPKCIFMEPDVQLYVYKPDFTENILGLRHRPPIVSTLTCLNISLIDESVRFFS